MVGLFISRLGGGILVFESKKPEEHADMYLEGYARWETYDRPAYSKGDIRLAGELVQW